MTTLLKKVDRPRELKWHQAGAMLYGDWGTSKAYVLGIAFALSGHASWFFLGLMSGLTALVGMCYMVVCRIYPDGGGVYSSVKNRSSFLAVLGALMLIADYVVTASLSALDAFHYFNVPNPELWAVCAIALIGLINWVGPTKGSTIAAYIAVCASLTSIVLFAATLPHLPHVELQWPVHDWGRNWSVFVGIVLALSGVEAVANMTGIMVEPVEKTAKKAIWAVMLEVSVLTFLLGIAMNSIPGLKDHAEDMLRAIGDHYIGPWYGYVISFVFGFLLLSAVNTAITGLVGIQYVLARDRELPKMFSSLNRFGMPGLALAVATAVPIIVLIVEHDVVGLASLYAIGVVGAITLNLGSTATNFQVDLKKRERVLLFGATLVLFFIELTICYEKHAALLFATSVVTVGLLLRYAAKVLIPPPVLEVPSVNVLTVAEAKEIAPLYKCSFLVGLKQLNMSLLKEAALRAKALHENAVYLDYVEEVPSAMELPTELEPSPESLKVLDAAQKEIEQLGVTGIPIWQAGDMAGRQIARAADELGVDTVMIGTTKRSALLNMIQGDVLRTLTRYLPRSCKLIITG